MLPHYITSLLGVLCGALPSQSVVVPNAFANVRGTTNLTAVVGGSASPRTYMLGIAAAELAAIPIGATITGISFRAARDGASTSWPPTDTTWRNYEVTIGSAISLAAWTATFASNFTRPPVVARGGAMVIEAAALAVNPALPAPQPNAFAEFYWDLQAPFLYFNGDLAILISHDGNDQAQPLGL